MACLLLESSIFSGTLSNFSLEISVFFSAETTFWTSFGATCSSGAGAPCGPAGPGTPIGPVAPTAPAGPVAFQVSVSG